MDITIKDFIFCDDIRSEEGRKFSIMGVYADRLRVLPKAPGLTKFRLPISAYIRFESSENVRSKAFDFLIDVTFDETSIARIEGELNFGGEKFSTLPIAGIELKIEKPGALNFRLEVFGKDKQSVMKYSEALNVVIEQSVELIP